MHKLKTVLPNEHHPSISESDSKFEFELYKLASRMGNHNDFLPNLKNNKAHILGIDDDMVEPKIKIEKFKIKPNSRTLAMHKPMKKSTQISKSNPRGTRPANERIDQKFMMQVLQKYLNSENRHIKNRFNANSEIFTMNNQEYKFLNLNDYKSKRKQACLLKRENNEKTKFHEILVEDYDQNSKKANIKEHKKYTEKLIKILKELPKLSYRYFPNNLKRRNQSSDQIFPLLPANTSNSEYKLLDLKKIPIPERKIKIRNLTRPKVRLSTFALQSAEQRQGNSLNNSNYSENEGNDGKMIKSNSYNDFSN